MSKEICPHCKGKGYTRKVGNWFIGAMTFGMTALMELSNENKCHICDGKGYWEK